MKRLPTTGDIELHIVIGGKFYLVYWPVIPRVGEYISGYMLGTRLISGRVLSVHHHMHDEDPHIEVRLHSRSILP